MSEDPIGFKGGGVNFYAYVENRPTTRKDPLGLMSWQQAQGKGMTWSQWWNDPSTTTQDQINAETLEPNPAITDHDGRWCYRLRWSCQLGRASMRETCWLHGQTGL